MHRAETTAVRRAALLLVCVSAIRWGVSSRPTSSADRGEDVLPELIRRTNEATVDRARRERPFTEGERIDPNRADAGELDRLPGVGPAIAAAIVEARESGTGFQRAEDLLQVRGIGPSLLAGIEDALDFARAPPSPGRRPGPRRGPAGGLVDVNRAGVQGLQELPGIGPVIAERVVATRLERPFRTVEELARVPGIGPATVDRLRRLVTVGLVR